MCGIISYFSNDKIYRQQMQNLVHNALWIDSIRGDHSTGIIYETDGLVDYYKKAVPGYDFVNLPLPNAIIGTLQDTRFLIGHNRAATLGNINSANAHPFECDHIIGVHNGTLSNHKSLTEESYQVDSHHLYAAISERGTAEVLPQVQGSFNLLWHDDSDNTVHMVRNTDRPYTFAKLKDKEVLIGMSEKAMLKWLVNRHGFAIEYCWTPENLVEYVWSVDEDMVKPKHQITHKAYAPPAPKKQQKSGPVSTLTPNTARETLEFFIDCLVPNTFLINGEKCATLHGETIEGDEVTMNCVPESQSIEIDTWYVGKGSWFNTDKGYWLVDRYSVKPHPLESGESGALHICVNCAEDFSDNSVVYIDNAPLCIECCQNFNVKAEDCDDQTEAWKLMIN